MQTLPKDDNSSSSDGSDYVPSEASSPTSSSDLKKINFMELTPSSKRWFMDNEYIPQKLGIDYDLCFQYFNALPLETRFVVVLVEI